DFDRMTPACTASLGPTLLSSLFAAPFLQPCARRNGRRGPPSVRPATLPGVLPARLPRAQPVLPARAWLPPPLPQRSELAWQAQLRAAAVPLHAAPRVPRAPPRWLRAAAFSRFWPDQGSGTS